MKQWMVVSIGLLALAGCASSSSDSVENSATSDLSATHDNACTSNFGNGLSGTNGRLDGTVYAVVAPTSSHACNACNVGTPGTDSLAGNAW